MHLRNAATILIREQTDIGISFLSLTHHLKGKPFLKPIIYNENESCQIPVTFKTTTISKQTYCIPFLKKHMFR